MTFCLFQSLCMQMFVHFKIINEHNASDLTLRPYQLEGVNWLLGCYDNKHGCILGDEMGLGKTCQVCAYVYVFL